MQRSVAEGFWEVDPAVAQILNRILDLAEQEIAEHRMAVQAVHVPQGQELLVPEIPPFSDHESVGIVDLWS